MTWNATIADHKPSLRTIAGISGERAAAEAADAKGGSGRVQRENVIQ